MFANFSYLGNSHFFFQFYHKLFNNNSSFASKRIELLVLYFTENDYL